jgi:hypothetical protein
MDRHRYTVDQGGTAGKARLLRIRAERPAAGRRCVDEPARDVVAHHLVGRGIEIHARRCNTRLTSAGVTDMLWAI